MIVLNIVHQQPGHQTVARLQRVKTQQLEVSLETQSINLLGRVKLANAGVNAFV